MTNPILNVFFIIQFIVIICSLLAKLYNLMSVGKFYDLRMATLLWVSTFIAYAIGFVVMMLETSSLIYSRVFLLETWILGLIVMFSLFEYVIMLAAAAKGTISAYKPK